LTIRKPERAALAVARAIDGLMPTCETLASFDARSSDSLEDEVLQRVAAWDARALGLPCFALVEWQPFEEGWEPHTRMLDPSPRRTLTVLARQRGRLFLRDEAPVRMNLALHQRHRLLVPRSGVAA
jgi:hypothetical protein